MIGVYPGTFDPITLGHRDVIVRAVSKLCDTLIIGVANNTSKRPLFSYEERLKMVQAEVCDMELEHCVKVMSLGGLLTDFVRETGADIVVRGLRAVSDFEYEFQMAFANSKLDNSVETVFLMASQQHHFTASSLVREVAQYQGDVQHFVSSAVAEAIRQKFV